MSKNLLHLFHLRENARRVKGAIADDTEFNRLAVIGAGIMGGGIAQVAAYRGMHVRLKDIRHDSISGGLSHASKLFREAVKRRKLSKAEAAEKMELISGGLDQAGIAAANVVVEAVVEKIEVKKAVLAEADQLLQSEGILASNTSSLSIDEMAKALTRPERFCGIHFFNPVHRMPLVEIVRGAETNAETVEKAYAFVLRLGKIPVVVNDGPGFLVNRILGPYLNEAGHLLSEGISVGDIDRAALRFGMPMGPLRLMDEIGLDIAHHAGQSLFEAFGEGMAVSPALEALQGTQRLGKKGGKGFYRYPGGKKKPEPDPDLIFEIADAVRPNSNSPGEDEIQRRLVAAMINEAARVLDAGIAGRAADVDLGMIMGTGFPPFRGGLLRFADSVHPREILVRMEELASNVGPRFEPAPLLQRLAQENRTFYQGFP